MSLPAFFTDLAARLQSAEFLQMSRHSEHPKAFTRNRKLPLPSLVALLLTGMRMSVQAELDVFFAHLRQQAQLVRHVSEQAFAQARAKLSLSALPQLNDWVIERAEHYGFIPRWRGLRLVAADASTMRFGLRASHVKRAALADQIAFGLFLPGAELMLAVTVTLLACCQKCSDNCRYEPNRSTTQGSCQRPYLLCRLPISARCDQLCGVAVLPFSAELAHGRGVAGGSRH